jgi:hypothetical protein
MAERRRIEGFAIVSADGMIADAAGVMPEALKNDADLRFFAAALDRAAILAHGRHSHEQHANSARRPRLVLTRRVAAHAPAPELPNALLWNPAGATLEEACAALGAGPGFLAVIGGPTVYRLFLELGYDAFYLSRSARVRLPGGLPLFGDDGGATPEESLARRGLKPGAERVLDESAAVTVTTWRKRAA